MVLCLLALAHGALLAVGASWDAGKPVLWHLAPNCLGNVGREAVVVRAMSEGHIHWTNIRFKSNTSKLAHTN